MDCYLDSPSMLTNVKWLYLGMQRHEVVRIRPAGRFFYAQFADICDRTCADTYKDFDVFAEKEDLTLEEGKYFLQDVLGCVVYLDDGTVVGEVCDVAQYGAADVYTTCKDGKEISFPFLKTLVESVNVSAKRIVLFKQRFQEVAVIQDEN